jgi:hypothetical protein
MLINEARIALADVAIAAADEFPASHVTPYPPSQLVAPAIYVDMPRIYRGELGTLGDWPVFVVVDGDDWAQMLALDNAVSILWDAYNAVDGWDCPDASPVARDVGGPSLRAYQFTVTTFLTLDVLCASLSTLANA